VSTIHRRATPDGPTIRRLATQLPIAMLDPVRRAHPELELVELPMKGPLPDGPPFDRFDALLTLPNGTPNLADVLARGVRWVHAYGTGVNGFPFALLDGVPLTCSRGASATAISEWVIAVLLEHEKRLLEHWLAAPPPVWHRAELGTLAGRTLALVGFGGIARAIARRALPFDMRVRALRRSDAPSDVEGVEMVRGLEALVRDADHVVIAAPETKATHRLIDDRVFAWLKPGAHLVNIARGGIVDQDALRRALDAGRVGRATLDCVEPEPLPAGHWLYSHPRVRVSAHISWSGADANAVILESFLENLERTNRGEPLRYRVDPDEGY
jgi:phosphoglycerate dehydrogenase-like enzyme